MTGTVTLIGLVWGIVFLIVAIPGAAIGWIASATLGYRWGIAISVICSIGVTLLAMQLGWPGAFLYLPPLLVAALLGVWISRRTLRLRKWLPAATVLLVAAGYGGPLLLTYIMYREQDECSFGPVSNA